MTRPYSPPPSSSTEPYGAADDVRQFWPRLAKAAVLLLVGAMAHQMVPSRRAPGQEIGSAPQRTADGERAAPPDAPALFSVVPDSLSVAIVPPSPMPAAASDDVAETLPNPPPSVKLLAVGTAGTSTPARSAVAKAKDAPIEVKVREADNPPASDEPAAADSAPARPLASTIEAPVRRETVVMAPPVAAQLTPAEVLAAIPAVQRLPHEGMTAEAEVRRALQNYREAYESLDVAAARMVWPSVDHVALTHAFRQLASQRVTFQSCGISVSGASALARCRGQAEYVPKVGAQRALMASGEWVFDLTKSDADWKIVSASVR